MKVSAINVYPIKSMRGSTLEESLVCSYGLENDRRWMLVDPESHMITQRECPLLATLTPQVDASGLRVAAPGHEDIFVPHDADRAEQARKLQQVQTTLDELRTRAERWQKS